MYLRPYNDNQTLSPDNSLNLPSYVTKQLLTSAIYVGGTGDVTVVNENDSTAVFKAVPVGTFLPVAVKRVNATGTTATLLVACYWV